MGDMHEADEVRRFDIGTWKPLGADKPIPLSELTDRHLANIKRMLERNHCYLMHRYTVLTAPQNVLLACIRIRAKLDEIDRELTRRSDRNVLDSGE